MHHIAVHHGELGGPKEKKDPKARQEPDINKVIEEHPWLEDYLAADDSEEEETLQKALEEQPAEKAKHSLSELTEEQQCLVWQSLESKRRAWEAVAGDVQGRRQDG
eukprot:7359604-Lingulodinium_polyedra.AAC.1